MLISDNGCHQNCSGNQSFKRNLDLDQSFTKKRVRDEDIEMSSQPLVYHLNDSRLYREEEEEEYREYTEEEQMIMNISNQLINFNLNMIESIEWDEYYVDRSPEKGSPPKSSKREVEFPLKEGRVLHGYFFETLISASKRTAIYIGYRVKNPNQRFVIKIGFEMGFHRLQDECNIYQKLKSSKCVPTLVDYLWYDLRSITLLILI